MKKAVIGLAPLLVTAAVLAIPSSAAACSSSSPCWSEAHWEMTHPGEYVIGVAANIKSEALNPGSGPGWAQDVVYLWLPGGRWLMAGVEHRAGESGGLVFRRTSWGSEWSGGNSPTGNFQFWIYESAPGSGQWCWADSFGPGECPGDWGGLPTYSQSVGTGLQLGAPTSGGPNILGWSKPSAEYGEGTWYGGWGYGTPTHPYGVRTSPLCIVTPFEGLQGAVSFATGC
jgi:hypothetical protein